MRSYAGAGGLRAGACGASVCACGGVLTRAAAADERDDADGFGDDEEAQRDEEAIGGCRVRGAHTLGGGWIAGGNCGEPAVERGEVREEEDGDGANAERDAKGDAIAAT